MPEISAAHIVQENKVTTVNGGQQNQVPKYAGSNHHCELIEYRPAA